MWKKLSFFEKLSFFTNLYRQIEAILAKINLRVDVFQG